MPEDLDEVSPAEDLDDLEDDIEPLGDDDLDDLEDEGPSEDLDEDEDADGDGDEDEEGAPVQGRTRTTTKSPDDAEDEDEDEDEDDDVEASLDVILKERLVVEDEPEDEDEVADAEDRSEGNDRVRPKQPDEFVCRSCFLVKHPSQLADRDRLLCRDCV